MAALAAPVINEFFASPGSVLVCEVDTEKYTLGELSHIYERTVKQFPNNIVVMLPLESKLEAMNKEQLKVFKERFNTMIDEALKNE